MELDFPLEIKAVTDKGTFTGFASVYGNTDEGGDMIEAGAFAETLKERGAERPLLWQHDMSAPIGLGQLKDSPEGLIVEGTLDLDVTAGKEAYSRLRKRIVKGLSIGYRTIKDDFAGKVRLLKQIDLLEVSLVTLPMNRLARVTAIKSIATIRDFETWLHEQGFSKREAAALASHGFKGLAAGDSEEDSAAAELAAWLASQRAA